MSLIKDLFGKNVSSLSESDLIDYFKAKRIESDSIEYKSWMVRGKDDPKLREEGILRTICGMLNSGGGVIIWGSPEKTREGDEEFITGDLVPVEKNYEKDSFISKISERIIPTPQNIRFHKIEVQDNTKFVYLIRVNESLYKPHQFDSIYYLRLDGQTKKAPHHYIEALMRQVRYPDLQATITIQSLSRYYEELPTNGRRTGKLIYSLRFTFFILNMSGHINEEDVNYTLITTTGRIESYTSGDRSRYTKKQTIYKSGDPHSVLSYGDTLSDRVDIIAHEDELKSADYKFIFVLLFGGRKSPQKRCDYNFDCNSWNAETPQDGLVRANENKLIIDHVIEKGFTKADIIRFAEERIYP